MQVIGLTGGIATGKTTVARMVRLLGLPVFDADQTVHALLQPGTKSFNAIASRFPEVIEQDVIHRGRLGERVFTDDAARLELEAILHPQVRQAELNFISQSRRQRRRAVVLDVPLLYESGADRLCHAIWLTHCPPLLQKKRAMQRPGMNEKKYACIVASQWPQRQKRKQADVVIFTGAGKGATMRQVKYLVSELRHA